MVIKKDTIALIHVIGKMILSSVVGPDISCFRTVGPIHAPEPVKLKKIHEIQRGI
jgi:hypothetical protein